MRGKTAVVLVPLVAAALCGARPRTTAPEVLARAFLEDFSHSALSADRVMQHFHSSCPGTVAERHDVEFNRATRQILAWQIGRPRVSPGPVCPFRGVRADLCIAFDVEWRSRVLETGHVERAVGVDHVGAVYRDGRWWLCSSDWEPHK